MRKVLQDANLKLATVLSDVLGRSGRAILDALVAGESDPARLAALVGTRVKASHRDPTRLRDGLAQYEGAGQYVATSFFRALLVEELMDLDRLAEAEAELSATFAFVERSGERRHLAELHRLRGECLRRSGGASEVEARASLAQALTIAREQGARLWEMRAATSLASWGP